jgi:hypothetical protein
MSSNIQLEYVPLKAMREVVITSSRAIIAEAKTLAEETGQRASPIAIIVWDGAPRGSTDATQEFADLARASGFQVKEVQTLGT